MKAGEVFQKFPVELAYQFGSSVQGKTGPMSDIDVAVLLDPSVKEEEYFAIQLELLRALDPVFDYRTVDLVLLNRAGPLLRYEVLCGGRLLFCREEQTRVEFEQRVLSDYFDTAHLRRVQYQALLARLNDGALGDPSRVYFI
ncbi:MAG: nucleotidyltransferase domain-containing protein [Candidatus Omnitrophica bacterium]|nr:nucleotidyltransferase domain-containing protein [Candidatus Omnitrophota bacterium]